MKELAIKSIAFIVISILLSNYTVHASICSDTIIRRITLPHDELLIGVISDGQFAEEDEKLTVGHFGCVMKGPRHFLSAIRYFKNQNVDLMIMNGDMVNAGPKNAYNTFNMMLDDVFGKDRTSMPPLIYPLGNHEYYSSNPEKDFKDNTGLPLNCHYVINGIHFIGVSCSDGSGGYNNSRLSYLKKHLAIAQKEANDKPIIVISHMPFNVDEFYGGEWCSPQADKMYAILKDYPQVIYFSGHSHYPIYSEKSFIQKDFTMINTGGIAYFDLLWNLSADGKTLDENKPNEYINPHLIGIFNQHDIYQRDAFNQGWELRIQSQSGNVKLQRMDYTLKRPFGEPIVLKNLHKKEFTRTLACLKSQAKNPRFPSNASIHIQQTEKGVIDICFDSSLSDVITQHYELNFIYPDKTKKRVRIMAQSFYLGWDFPYKEHLRFYGCKQPGDYKLSIKAISSMGKESCSITTQFKIKE